ncbi:MAG: transporter, partial [Deltaproteobacteria bacterium]|nr:transporter [Deltaproteobacteria bacterium]
MTRQAAMNMPRRIRTATASLAALTMGVVVAAQPSDARAQEGPGLDGEFSVQRFEPVPGPRNFMSVAGARTDGEWAWTSALMFDYQHNPFVVQSCVSETDCDDANAVQTEDTAVVSDMLTWNLLASITPIPIIQVGLRVPVAFVSGAGMDFEGPTAGAASQGSEISAAGLGDIALEGKVRIWGEPNDPIVFGAALDVAAPLGHATSEGNYIGNRTPISVGGRGIVDLKLDGFTASANLRGIYREDSSFGDTTIGPEFRWGVGAGYQFHEMFRGIAEGYGATRFSDVKGTNSVEIDGGIQVLPLDGRLVITAAGGTGLVKGIGVPVARAIFGVAFHYEAANDQDGDGIPNDEDQCPNEAEDK